MEGPSARQRFHIALFGVLLPVVSLPFVWLFALAARHDADAPPGERRWAQALLALAVLDSMFAVAVVALVVWVPGGARLDFARTPPPPRARIGVRATEGATAVPARISGVLTGSPAERAGLRPGDLIDAVDGAPVETFADVATTIAGGREGVPRVLSIARGDERLEVTVVPEDPASRAGTGLFRRWSGEPCSGLGSVAHHIVRAPGLWVVASLVLVLFLALRSLRGTGPPLWRWVALAIGGGIAASTAASHAACALLGGPIAGNTLVAGSAQTSVILIVAGLGYRTMRRRGVLHARIEPALETPAAIGFGVLYLLALIPRVQVVLLALVQMTDRDIGGRTVIAEAAAAVSGWDARVLLVIAVVVLAPIGEELLFRGVILPCLHLRLGATASVAATSVLFAALHFDYGVRMITIFVLSAVLGWSRLATGGLAAPIALHALTNAVGVLLILRS